MFIPLKRRQQ